MEQNIFGNPLLSCCANPATGYFRDGLCRTISQDSGTHTVCALVTQEFLDYSASKGNDLMTPIPHWQFPGLKPGDKWCLCAERFKEAYDSNCAPKVVLEATNEETLKIISIEKLIEHANYTV